MLNQKWRVLALLSLAEMMAMSLWFAAAAIIPQLSAEWSLGDGQAAWLTLSVQLGFVAGTLVSAALNLPDRYSAAKLVASSCLLAAVLTWAVSQISIMGPLVIVLRFATGVALAGVYPPGMKIVASWFRTGRGFGVGVLVGALTLGKALPYLMNAYDMGMPPWRDVLQASAALCLLGGLITLWGVSSGPHLQQAVAFHWRHALSGLANRPTRLANFGYFGHMWELYAMWTWMPAMLLASFLVAGHGEAMARLAAFVAIAAGAPGCILAGLAADRLGRTTITIVSLVVSGTCALTVGLFFFNPFLLTLICVLWGFAVVADSAQFSAAVTELSDRRYLGTALTIQTSVGFLLTMITIGLVPLLVDWVGWQWAFLVLVPGPIFGIVAMARLRGLPEATKMAHGNR